MIDRLILKPITDTRTDGWTYESEEEKKYRALYGAKPVMKESDQQEHKNAIRRFMRIVSDQPQESIDSNTNNGIRSDKSMTDIVSSTENQGEPVVPPSNDPNVFQEEAGTRMFIKGVGRPGEPIHRPTANGLAKIRENAPLYTDGQSGSSAFQIAPEISSLAPSGDIATRPSEKVIPTPMASITPSIRVIAPAIPAPVIQPIPEPAVNPEPKKNEFPWKATLATVTTVAVLGFLGFVAFLTGKDRNSAANPLNQTNTPTPKGTNTPAEATNMQTVTERATQTAIKTPTPITTPSATSTEIPTLAPYVDMTEQELGNMTDGIEFQVDGRTIEVTTDLEKLNILGVDIDQFKTDLKNLRAVFPETFDSFGFPLGEDKTNQSVEIQIRDIDLLNQERPNIVENGQSKNGGLDYALSLPVENGEGELLYRVYVSKELMEDFAKRGLSAKTVSRFLKAEILVGSSGYTSGENSTMTNAIERTGDSISVDASYGDVQNP